MVRAATATFLLAWLHAAAAAVAATPHSAAATPSYTLTAWTGHQNLSLGDVFAIAEDRDGYLWLGTSNGLVRFDGAVFTRRPTGASARATEGPVSTLLGASDGSLWVGYGGGGGLVRMHTDQVTRFSPGNGSLPGTI